MALGVKHGDGERWTETRGRPLFAYWQAHELDAALAATSFRVLEAEPLGLSHGSWLWRLAVR